MILDRVPVPSPTLPQVTSPTFQDWWQPWNTWYADNEANDANEEEDYDDTDLDPHHDPRNDFFFNDPNWVWCPSTRSWSRTAPKNYKPPLQ